MVTAYCTVTVSLPRSVTITVTVRRRCFSWKLADVVAEGQATERCGQRKVAWWTPEDRGGPVGGVGTRPMVLGADVDAATPAAL